VVSNQPADSIIVYATSAGSTAADGAGRNGLFTTHLLANLKKPGLSVRDMFDQTGADVRRASGGAQIPAIYSQFFDAVYLGTRPAAASPARPAAAPAQPAPNVSGAPAIRYDGLYCEANGNSTSYLRFYSNGTVISVSSTGTPDQIVRWFNAPYENSGIYTIAGDTVSFETTSSHGKVAYRGKILADRLVLDTHSYINGRNAKAREYIFTLMK
jgi:hypothetical protein